ncbi:hypothetical protein TNCV_658151 [Trichonephila clavipes]|uniref:Uncharacterized protein n=1 Tax=Trichonephila clavipes TaxID=2585209 RepID=A0A8X6SP67_TRICX|nr:hypothetical protein TNCV_658151 [Trichonephila clavipes]
MANSSRVASNSGVWPLLPIGHGRELMADESSVQILVPQKIRRVEGLMKYKKVKIDNFSKVHVPALLNISFLHLTTVIQRLNNSKRQKYRAYPATKKGLVDTTPLNHLVIEPCLVVHTFVPRTRIDGLADFSMGEGPTFVMTATETVTPGLQHPTAAEKTMVLSVKDPKYFVGEYFRNEDVRSGFLKHV